MKVLVTGCIGFIGSHVSEYLLKRNDIVIGIDNISDLYDIRQKKQNLEVLQKYPKFLYFEEDITTTNLISEHQPDVVCHLAAYASVLHSIKNPKIYVNNNINGTINLLEQCKNIKQSKPIKPIKP